MNNREYRQQWENRGGQLVTGAHFHLEKAQGIGFIYWPPVFTHCALQILCRKCENSNTLLKDNKTKYTPTVNSLQCQWLVVGQCKYQVCTFQYSLSVVSREMSCSFSLTSRMFLRLMLEDITTGLPSLSRSSHHSSNVKLVKYLLGFTANSVLSNYINKHHWNVSRLTGL